MKTTHTPGDWRIGKRGGNAGVGAIYGPKGEEIAVFSGMLSPDEELANARLIVLIPQFLEALEMAQSVIEDLEYPSDAPARKIAALLARATQP